MQVVFEHLIALIWSRRLWLRLLGWMWGLLVILLLVLFLLQLLVVLGLLLLRFRQQSFFDVAKMRMLQTCQLLELIGPCR